MSKDAGTGSSGGSRRRQARERVLQVLYAHTLSAEPLDPILEVRLADLKGKPEEYRFADVLARTVLENLAEIDALIEAKVEHWASDRIAVIDRIILRMGVAELCFFPEIPPKVTINESIEIGKLYSTENSGRFINGILDAVLEAMTANGTIRKSGRGLLDHSLRSTGDGDGASRRDAGDGGADSRGNSKPRSRSRRTPTASSGKGRRPTRPA